MDRSESKQNSLYKFWCRIAIPDVNQLFNSNETHMAFLMTTSQNAFRSERLMKSYKQLRTEI
jgi:hypothetical protein